MVVVAPDASPVEWLGSGAVGADHPIADLLGQSVAVLHEEAARAGELVGLLGHDPHGELFTGQIGAGQFECFEFGLAVIDVKHGSGGIIAPASKRFERLVGDVVGFLLAGSIVVSGHGGPLKCGSGVTTT